MRVFAILLGVFLCLTVFPVTAFAGGGEEEISPIPEETETQKTDPAPLTPDGNLTLVDDIAEEQSEDKQFVTLVSKNGNYFYLVIDRAGDKQNVYFLNLVDEADLLALIEGEVPEQPQVSSKACDCTNLCEDGKVDPNCELCEDDLTKCTGKTTPSTPEPEDTEEKSNRAGGILLILFIVGMAGGGFYYFKVLKNKGNTKGNTVLEEYDFDDEDDDEEYEYEVENEDVEDESEDI